MKISEKLEVAYATMRPPTLDEVREVEAAESRITKLEAEVARLKEENRHDSEADRACKELLVEELDEALAKVKELRAELSTAKRTATEDALGWSFDQIESDYLPSMRDESARPNYIQRGIKALLGEEKP